MEMKPMPSASRADAIAIGLMTLFAFIMMLGSFWFGLFLLSFMWVPILLRTNYRQSLFAQFSAIFTIPSLPPSTEGEPALLIASSAIEPVLSSRKLVVYTIRLPKDTTWQSAKAISLITQLIPLGRIILRIKAEPNSISWQVVDANASPWEGDTVARAIRAAYLEAEVSVAQELSADAPTTPVWRRVDYFSLDAIFPAPLLYAKEITKVDPLNVLVNALSELREGESVTFSIALGEVDEQILKLASDLLYHSKVRSAIAEAPSSGKISEDIGAMLAAAALSQVLPQQRRPKYAPNLMQRSLAKLNEALLSRCFIAIEANSPERDRLANFHFVPTFVEFANDQQALASTDHPFVLIDDAPSHIRAHATFKLIELMEQPIAPLHEWASVLNAFEIAALWHLPHTGMTAPEISWIRGKQVVAPLDFRGSREGIHIGHNRPSRKEVYQPHKERTSHTLVLGKTGTGKTSLMHAMVSQDIAAGFGVAVIDPVGGFIRRILQHSIPASREDDVVILDVDFELDGVFYPPPINLTSRPQKTNRQETAFQFASVMTKLYDDVDQTRWLQTLEAALLTLAAEEQSTLLDLKRVLQDVDYREHLTAQLDPTISQLWDDIQLTGGLDQASLSAIIWRLNRFTLNPTLRTITCHPKPLDFTELIRTRKIILISVSADDNKIPESARNVLGAIVLSQIQMAALGGAILEPKTRPFMLYIDEVHNFITTSLDVIARQARQKGLGLVVATQYARSIASKTLKALEGNIGTLVTFETDVDDAHLAIPLMEAFDAVDLSNLGRFKAAVSMRSGETSARSSFSLDPLSAPDISTEAEKLEREMQLRRRSVENYTPMTYDEVNQWLTTRYQPRPGRAKTKDDGDDFGNPIQ